MVMMGVRLGEPRLVHLVVAQGRSVIGHPTVAEYDGAVDQRRQRAELMRDEHDGRPACLLLFEGVGEHLLVR